MIRPLLTTLVIGLSAALPASALDDAINEVIDRELAASGVPGVSYAVVVDGELGASGARGVARLGENAPVTADTPFLTGSISKSFTALAVMQFVEAGGVELDVEISTYLDDFSGQRAGAITIRQLLSHTSGFSTLQGNAGHTDARGDADELERLVDELADETPAYEPGTRWEYSNTNYQILGRLVEVISGREFQAYVTEHILEPIGMSSSFVADGETHDAMVTGHRSWFATKLPLPETATDRATAPQGGIVASANDLARYLQVMINGQDDVLSAEGKAQMMQPSSAASPFYGFGWFLYSSDGTVSHSGASPGFETLATMIPGENRAVVVLTNGGSGLGFGDTLPLRSGITAAALGLEDASAGPDWGARALFIGMTLLPMFYLASIGWAWRHRAAIRAKRAAGFAGLFSLWFPLLTTAVAAWVILGLVPSLIGSPFSTINHFQPDVGLVFIAAAATGVAWAVLRLGIAYARRGGRAES